MSAVFTFQVTELLEYIDDSEVINAWPKYI